MDIYRLTITERNRWGQKTRTKFITKRHLKLTLQANRFYLVKVERAPVGEFVDVTAEYQ